MNKSISLLLFIILAFSSQAQKKYKAMIDDLSINFYDVCQEAENYFKDKNINEKGTGWKGYMRWRIANEYKYYPDGNRETIDPYFTAKAYSSFLENNILIKSLFPNGWQELGPYRIDSITGHYAAGLGRIEDFYVDPNNSNIIYLGSRSGGFWKSTNGGTTWQGGVSDFLPASGVNAIAVNPSNTNNIFINVQNSRNSTSHGIYQSTNGGNSFMLSNFNPSNLNQGGLGSNFKIYTIAFHPTINDLVFVGTNEGLYRSTDGLQTWTQLYASSDIIDIAFHPSNSNIIYLYDNYYFSPYKNVVLRSIDTGQSFFASTTIAGNNDARGKLAVASDCPDCLFFASNNGIWKSIDNGQNFSFLNNPNENCYGGFAVKDNDSSKMIYGYVDLDVSSNGGVSFQDATRWSLGNTNAAGNGNQESFNNSTNYIHADVRNAKSINGVFYVATDGLLAKSTDDGINWQVISQGTAIRENYKLGVSQSNHYRSISGSQDNGTSIKHQKDWIEFYGADGMECLIHPLNDDWMIGSFQFGGRRQTRDGGQTQKNISPAGQSGSGSGAWEAPIAYDPNQHMRIYNFSDSIYVSEDFGDTWTYRGVPNGITNEIRQAAIAENNSNIIVISSGDKIEKSIDAGTSFTSIKNNLPNHSIQDIAFAPNDDDIIVVVYARYQNDNEKVFLTTDGGISWSNITHNLGSMPIQSVVIDHTSNSNIYLGAEIGVFTKALNSTTWNLYNNNLPNTTIEELEIVYGSNTLKAATWGRGLWEYALVDRINYPAIVKTKINDMPTLSSPKNSTEQYIQSLISYSGVLSEVYVKWSANSPVFNNTITMSNSSDSTWISDLPLPDLAAGTDIYFKVFAVGENNDTTETYKFMYTLHPFVYCNTSGSTDYDGNVTLVNFNTINKATGKIQAYSDFTATDSTTVYQGIVYDLTVNLNTDNGNFEYFSSVWIDWNQDADFDDLNERYELGSTVNNSNGATSLSPLSIGIPSNAKLGKTRMRVSCKYNNLPTACEENMDGEVEDYSIIVLESPIQYQVEEQVICQGDMIHFNYTGSAASNIVWTFSNGTNTYSASNMSDSLQINEPGSYTLSIDVIVNGYNFNKIEHMAFEVQNSFEANLNANGLVLNALPTNLQYIWLNCEDNFNPIPNVISDNYTVTENGSYAVQIINNVCQDTSECIQIEDIGIIENSFAEQVVIFPNPIKNTIYILFEKPQELLSLSLYNIEGKKIWKSNKQNQERIEINLPNLSTGLYYLHINSKSEKAIFKLLKK